MTKPKVIGQPLTQLEDIMAVKKGSKLGTADTVTIPRKIRDTSGVWTPTSIKKHRLSTPKPTPKPSKDSADFTLFLHVVGTNFRDKKYIEKFVGLPLERISEIHNQWFKRGRDNIAVSHIDQSLSIVQYERALNWIQGIVIMKASEEPEGLGKKILKHLRLR